MPFKIEKLWNKLMSKFLKRKIVNYILSFYLFFNSNDSYQFAIPKNRMSILKIKLCNVNQLKRKIILRKKLIKLNIYIYKKYY